MSDLGTAIAAVQGEIKSLLDDATVRRKIIDAMRFHKQNKLWFSERTFEFELTPSLASYGPGDGNGLPEDVLEITSRPLFLLINGSQSNMQRVHRALPNDFEYFRSSGTTSGDPLYWSFQSKRLQLWPTPALAHVLRGNYMRDHGTPYWTYDSGSFLFKAPDGSALSDTFTNDWLDPQGALHMIVARATYLCFQNLGDEAGATTALGSWLEYKAQIEDESEARVSAPVSIIGSILD